MSFVFWHNFKRWRVHTKRKELNSRATDIVTNLISVAVLRKSWVCFLCIHDDHECSQLLDICIYYFTGFLIDTIIPDNQLY